MESQPTVLQSIFETSAETSPRVTLQQYQNLFQNLYPLDVSGVDLHRRCGTILRVPPSPADTSVAYADMDDPEVMEEHAARSSSLPASIADIDDPEVVPMRGAHASSYQPASKRRRFETMSCTADNQTRSATVTAELEDLELLLHETFDQNNDRLPYAGNLGAADVLAQVGQNPVLAELESPSAASSLAGIEVAAHNMIGNCTKGNLSKVDKTSVSRIPHKRGSTPRSQSSAWMAAVTQGDKRTWTPIPMKPQAVASFLDDLQEVLDIMDGETRHVTRNTPLVYEIDSVDPRSQTNSQSHVPLSDGIAIETDHAIPSLGGSFCLDEPHLEVLLCWLLVVRCSAAYDYINQVVDELLRTRPEVRDLLQTVVQQQRSARYADQTEGRSSRQSEGRIFGSFITSLFDEPQDPFGPPLDPFGRPLDPFGRPQNTFYPPPNPTFGPPRPLFTPQGVPLRLQTAAFGAPGTFAQQSPGFGTQRPPTFGPDPQDPVVTQSAAFLNDINNRDPRQCIPRLICTAASSALQRPSPTSTASPITPAPTFPPTARPPSPPPTARPPSPPPVVRPPSPPPVVRPPSPPPVIRPPSPPPTRRPPSPPPTFRPPSPPPTFRPPSPPPTFRPPSPSPVTKPPKPRPTFRPPSPPPVVRPPSPPPVIKPPSPPTSIRPPSPPPITVPPSIRPPSIRPPSPPNVRPPAIRPPSIFPPSPPTPVPTPPVVRPPGPPDGVLPPGSAGGSAPGPPTSGGAPGPPNGIQPPGASTGASAPGPPKGVAPPGPPDGFGPPGPPKGVFPPGSQSGGSAPGPPGLSARTFGSFRSPAVFDPNSRRVIGASTFSEPIQAFDDAHFRIEARQISRGKTNNFKSSLETTPVRTAFTRVFFQDDVTSGDVFGLESQEPDLPLPVGPNTPFRVGRSFEQIAPVRNKPIILSGTPAGEGRVRFEDTSDTRRNRQEQVKRRSFSPVPSVSPGGRVRFPKLRRKKRFVGSLFGGLLRVLNAMAQPYSFYPYTTAALEGSIGTRDRCERLFPQCPASGQGDFVDIFNNLNDNVDGGVAALVPPVRVPALDAFYRG